MVRRSCLGGAAALLALSGCSRKSVTKPPAPTPVATATVARGDTPVEQIGLGQVQAFNTAVARAQVAGQIVKVQFTEGQTVHRGDLLVQVDPRSLQATVAQDLANQAKDKAALADAVVLLARDTPLAVNGLVSAQQLDTQRSQVAQLRATVQADQAVVQRDRLQLDFASVRAPIGGVTGLRLIDVGNLVGPSDPQGLVTVTQIQPIAVVFTLPQAALPALRDAINAAGPGRLDVEAYAQGGSTDRLDQGQLTVVNNLIDQASGTVTLKAVFPNALKRLWPGEAVEARVVLGRPSGGLSVPASAVQRNEKGAYVWVVRADSTAALQPVKLGAALGDRAVVEGGLSAGEIVVTDGQFSLTPGAHVDASGGKAATKTLKSPAPDRLGLTP